MGGWLGAVGLEAYMGTYIYTFCVVVVYVSLWGCGGSVCTYICIYMCVYMYFGI